MLCSTLLPYQNALTDPLLRCPITLYPSAFDHPSPPSPATQQASRAHDKRDLYNTCIVSQLSRNKYCLNQLDWILSKVHGMIELIGVDMLATSEVVEKGLHLLNLDFRDLSVHLHCLTLFTLYREHWSHNILFAHWVLGFRQHFVTAYMLEYHIVRTTA